jgi:hypothetical protein
MSSMFRLSELQRRSSSMLSTTLAGAPQQQSHQAGSQSSVHRRGSSDGSPASDGPRVLSNDDVALMHAQEAAGLKDELAMTQTRYEAIIANIKADAVASLEAVTRETTRKVGIANKEAREAARRIVQLSRELAEVKKTASHGHRSSFSNSGTQALPTDGPASSDAANGSSRLSEPPSVNASFAGHASIAFAIDPRSRSGSVRISAIDALRDSLQAKEAELVTLRAKLDVRDSACSSLESELRVASEKMLALHRESQLQSDLQSVPPASASPTAPQSPHIILAHSSSGHSSPRNDTSPEKTREMNRRVVELAKELAAVRAERDAAIVAREAERAARKAADLQADETAADYEAQARRLVAAEQRLADMASTVDQVGTQLDHLEVVKADLGRLRALQEEWEKKESHFARFRAQHERCSETIVDQRSRVFTLEKALQRAEAKAVEQQKAAHLATLAAEESRRKLATAQDEIESRKQQAQADAQTHEAAKSAHQQLLNDFRQKLDDETRRGEEQKASLSATQQRLTEAQATLDRLSGAKTSAELQLVRSTDAGAELVKLRALLREQEQTIAALRDENAEAKQMVRKAQADKSAAARDHADRLGAMQRLNLELLDTKQQLETRDRELAWHRSERENYVSRINDMYGSEADRTTITTTRRLLGLLESMSVELSQQVAEHLSLEYMRGGTRTANLFRRTFNLDADVARDVVEVLAHIYLALRTNSGIDHVCRTFNLKEISLRRIITGFGSVIDACSPGPRRRQLMLGTATALRVTFRGAERLRFLCGVSRPGSSLHRLRSDPYPLARICGFLTPVLRGFPAFAMHDRVDADTYRSIFLRLDVTARTFTMHEAQLTPNDGLAAVRLFGSYDELGPEAEALGSYRVDLRVEFASHLSAPLSGAVDWSKPNATSSAVRVTIKWDRRHDGLQAEITGGGRLCECAHSEADAIGQVFEDGKPVADVATDRSWRTAERDRAAKADANAAAA